MYLTKLPLWEVKSQCFVWLDRLEQNARIINIRAFNNNLDLYFDACQKLNLAILALLQKEGIDTLHLEFRAYLESYKQTWEITGKSIK